MMTKLRITFIIFFIIVISCLIAGKVNAKCISCHGGESKCCNTREEAYQYIPSHVKKCGYWTCFVWHDGPSNYTWRAIPGTGCAHWVAHELNKRNLPKKCYDGYSISVDGVGVEGNSFCDLQDGKVGVGGVINGLNPIPVKCCERNDIWTNGGCTHTGIAITPYDKLLESVYVIHCSSGQGGLADTWFSSGKCWTTRKICEPQSTRKICRENAVIEQEYDEYCDWVDISETECPEDFKCVEKKIYVMVEGKRVVDECQTTAKCGCSSDDDCRNQNDKCDISECVEGECKAVSKDCDDGNDCTSDSCNPRTGECIHRSIAGCDHPDENYDVSTLQISSDNVFDPESKPNIAILRTGEDDSMQKLLTDINESSIFVDIDFSLDDMIGYPILIIPSGGLYGLNSLSSFKSRLEQYVNDGGTLITFAQQHGYEFKALPSGEVSGFGWLEDQSCQYFSVGISTYHPVLSGQSYLTLNINVDGYFTNYPENTTILLSRTKNSMPAMLMYEYGKGKVIATTAYSDAAYGGLNQGTVDEKNLIRDVVAWAKEGKNILEYGSNNIVNISLDITNYHLQVPLSEFPHYELGGIVNISFNITNYADLAIDKISFLVFDPNYNQVGYVNVSAAIPPNEPRIVYFVYETSNASEKGFYSTLYSLYSGGTMVGGCDNPDECIEHGFAVGVNISEISSYKVNFTLRDPDKAIVKQENTSVYVEPGEIEAINFNYANPQNLGIWDLEYRVFDVDGNLVDSGIKKFAVSNYATNPNGWIYQGQKISFDVTSPQERVPRGSDIPFTIHIWNRGDTDTNITYYVYTLVFETRIRTVTVPANSESHSDEVLENVQGWIPSISVLFYNSSMGYIGSATRAIFLVDPSLKVNVTLDRDAYSIGDNLSIFLNIANPSSTPYDATVLVKLVDPKSNNIYEDTFDLTLNGSQSYAKNYNLSITLERGLYSVTAKVYSQGEKIGSNSAYFKVLRDYRFNVDFNNPYGIYKVREYMNITLGITNLGNLTWNSKINLSIPILNFQDSKEVSLNGGETKTISFNFYIPETTSTGSYDVVIFIGFDNTTSKRYFVIPNSQLVLSSNKASYSAGEYLAINLTNIGGVDTNYICSVTLYDTKSEVIYQNENLQGSIFVTQTETLTFRIPEQVISGNYYLIVDCKDLQTNQIARLSQDYEMDGLEASLISKTVKKIYFSLEDLSILTNITNSDIKIMNGRLHLKILRPYVPKKTHVLSGYVFNSSGNPLANVPLELDTEGWTDHIHNKTDSQGHFAFTNLTQDYYELYINEYEEEDDCSIKNKVNSCHEITNRTICENSYAEYCPACDLPEGGCGYFPCFWGDVGEGYEACYYSCDQCAFWVNQIISENYTSINFEDENIIDLTDDLEINATLLKIDAELELNSSVYKNGDVMKANVTVKNNENFNLTNWVAVFGVWGINETHDEELYMNLTPNNLLTEQTKSFIFTYKIPENNTYDRLNVFGGIGNLNYTVISSQGTIKALTYKVDETKIINVTS